MTDQTATRHTAATRILHGLLALAVIHQLGVSLFMEGPRPDRPDGWALEQHETVGIAALALIMAFWVAVAVRRRGTAPGALVPWFFPARRGALLAEARSAMEAIRTLRAPTYADASPLASAVHGLGLLLVTLMTLTGAAWLTSAPSALASAMIEVHEAAANLAWVYLVAHAGLAIAHHLRGEASLLLMWGRTPPVAPAAAP